MHRVLLSLLCVMLSPLPAFTTEHPVDLSASDGTKLKGTFFAAAELGPGVLLLHQCNRQRKVWDALAQQLSAAGINVLTFDYRGYGESGGERFDKLPPQQAAQVQAEKWPRHRYRLPLPAIPSRSATRHYRCWWRQLRCAELRPNRAPAS